MQIRKVLKDIITGSDRTENNLLLDALKKDDPERLRRLIADPKTQYRQIFYGLTFIDLIRYLNLKNTKKIYELRKYFPEAIEHFPDPVEPLNTLTFENFSVLQKVLQKTIHAKKEGLIQQYKIFRGAYYREEVEKRQYPDVKIRFVNDQILYGVFADQDIRAQKLVGEYTGVIRKRTNSLIKYNNYCLRYPISLDDPKQFVVDAKHAGNFTRYINHSDEPNLEIIGIYVFPFLRIIFRSLIPIAKGEQLTFDYGELFWKQSKQNYEPIFKETKAKPAS